VTTIAADPLRSAPRTTARWGVGFAIALALHGGLTLLLISRTIGVKPAGAPAAAVMIDLPPPPPEPPKPAPEPAVLPPLQPLPLPEPLPPEPEFKVPEPPPSPAPKPEVVLPPKPRPKPKARPHPIERPPEVQPKPQPPAVSPPAPAAPAPAPAPVASPAMVAAARQSWQSQLAGRLERYKRYPRPAQEQRQQGVVYLHFALDRQGNVLSSRIERGSGHAMLDEEALALLQRAQPLPSPPPEISGTRIELVVPIRFALRSDGW